MLLDFAQHSRLHAVVKHLSRNTADVLKRLHVTAQNRLKVLVLNEAAPQITAVSKHEREQPDRAPLSRDVIKFDIEVSKVHLSLSSSRRLEAHLEATLLGRTNFSDQITQCCATADVAHRLNLPKKSFNAQLGILTHTLGHVMDKRIDDTRTRRTRTITRRLHTILNVFANGLAIHI
ncbi:hypothetical protein CR51_21840 [Caballeronia megalochromosomata]|nr:hypothetical protein CR51_21840 [Caballeronia megalochromosomata]